jgi:hypothetical protein
LRERARPEMLAGMTDDRLDLVLDRWIRVRRIQMG